MSRDLTPAVMPAHEANDEMVVTTPALPRRSFFRKVTGLGGAIVAGIATTWIDAPSALAAPYCCDLAYPNGPYCGGRGDSSNFTCPRGYYKRVWYCTYGSNLYLACYECAAGSTCYSGPWKCSNYVVTRH